MADTAGRGAPRPWEDTTFVGTRHPRVDAYERVSGSASYTLDMTLPGMLHAAVVRCPHAHARVTSIDTARAARMPGVRAILTSSSPDAGIPWYHGRQGPTSVLFDTHCRHEGEEVTAVAADTLEQARAAARAVVVQYEELPFVVDPAAALESDAPRVHDTGNLVGKPSRTVRGDVTQGFAEADVVRKRTYRTPCEIHTPLEVHGSIARWDGDRLTVWDSTQGVFGVRSEVAAALDLPLSKVRVIGPYMGGGFGSKLAAGKYTIVAALLARRTGRPVKLFLTREESFLCAGNRPANRLTLEAGVRSDGTLTALQLTGLGVAGAYPAGSGTGHQVAELYRCDHVLIEETNVHINAGQARPFRAPGFPQCAWALEQMMDELAEAVGLDPVELRLRNLPDASQVYGVPYTSNGLARCLSEGAAAFGWKEARARRAQGGPIVRGVGVAACQWGYGGDPRATAILKYFADGSANLCFGASDLGTGTKTVMALVVAEELGVPPDRIHIEHADTGTTPFTVSSGGSQTVLVSAPAVRAAALEVRKQLLDLAADQLGVDASSLDLREGTVTGASAPLRIEELKRLRAQEVIIGVGTRAPHPPGKVALPFAAHFAEVEVDTRTGEVRVLRLLGAHDSGRVMSRLTYDNQVFGGMTMGVGFGMTEARVLDRTTGRMVNANWHDYKLPTALDVPADLQCLPIEMDDTECNSVGAKGLGEPATIPTAAAIANAVYHATGVRVTDTPVNPTQMASRLAARHAGR
jgi:CO/xanthine dehydrogenase Mo-binding subunit